MGARKSKHGNIYDAFVKRMFGRLLVMIDFLLSYADKEFVAAIDLEKIVPAPTHYFGKDGDERIADLIFQCPLKDGSGSLMAVIVFEHESGNLKKVPQKLHKNISAIWTAEVKEGKKILSAPYFVVLRTGKKPFRGRPPKMSDSLPKDKDGKPIGKTVEVDYDLFDLPAWDFDQLAGGPVLRAALGILKKMIEETGEDFQSAMLPLQDISDVGQRIEWTKELLDFVDKAMKAHNRRLDAEMVSRALKPIFKDKERTMIKSIFDEKIQEGEVKKGREMLLKYLRKRFRQVTKDVENKIMSMTDPVALDSWSEHAWTCQSMDEFAKAIR